MRELRNINVGLNKTLRMMYGSSNMTYDFASRGDLHDLFQIYISSSWDFPSNSTYFYDDEQRDDDDVKKRCRDLSRESIINTIFKTDGSGVAKSVKGGSIIGMVKFDVYSRADIKARESRQENLPVTPPRRMRKPTVAESGEKFLEHLDEWAMDWEVIRDHDAVYTHILKSYAESAPFLCESISVMFV